MTLLTELVRHRIASHERANKARRKRRQRKKERMQKCRTLTKGEGEDLMARKEADQQTELYI
jgi:hypothetical protein